MQPRSYIISIFLICILYNFQCVPDILNVLVRVIARLSPTCLPVHPSGPRDYACLPIRPGWSTSHDFTVVFTCLHFLPFSQRHGYHRHHQPPSNNHRLQPLLAQTPNIIKKIDPQTNCLGSTLAQFHK